MEVNSIQVKVSTAYISQQSDPDRERFVFSYTVEISNNGRKAAQLLRRYWVIKDAQGGVEEVRGDGVIGEQPLIDVGATYRYSSGAVLKTDVGVMEGAYEMINEDGESFSALIEPFTLSIPRIIH